MERRLFKLGFAKNTGNSNITKTVGRLIGSDISAPGVLGDSRSANSADWNFTFYSLRNGNSVVVATASFDNHPTLTEISKLATHQYQQKMLSDFGIKLSLDGQVDGVVGLVFCDKSLAEVAPTYWPTLISDSSRFVLDLTIIEHIATRVAIERSLLTWATKNVRLPARLFWAAIAGYRVRRWPVQLLTDRRVYASLLMELRNQFNLINVRAELLDRAKTWWAVFAAFLGIAGLIATVLALLGSVTSNQK